MFEVSMYLGCVHNGDCDIAHKWIPLTFMVLFTFSEDKHQKKQVELLFSKEAARLLVDVWVSKYAHMCGSPVRWEVVFEHVEGDFI